MRGGLTLLSKLVCKTSKKLTPGCPSSGSMMPPGGLGGGPLDLETSGACGQLSLIA